MKITASFLQISRCLLMVTLFGAARYGTAQDTDVRILDVPDYTWYAGCFGTACGNLMGYWDRNGFPSFYTGPTGGGVAPATSFSAANKGVRSMWASKAGVDGRPANQPGHIDDYWAYYPDDNNYSYESTLNDPYTTAGRPEHTPDCIGDFIGLSQRKWIYQTNNLAGECDGNIDAFSFVFWDTNGNRRLNYSQTNSGVYAPDIQSGLLEWTKYRSHEADVFTQLAEFNPRIPAGRGFTYANLKAEIDAGYPVLFFLQDYNHYSRSLSGMARANPEIHGILAYGYASQFGNDYAICRTSWGSGDPPSFVTLNYWSAAPFFSSGADTFPLRGVIAYHPKPKLRPPVRSGGNVTFTWDGPSSRVYNTVSGTTNLVHRYQLEKSTTLLPGSFAPVGSSTTTRSLTIPDTAGQAGFYRVKLLPPGA